MKGVLLRIEGTIRHARGRISDEIRYIDSRSGTVTFPEPIYWLKR